MKSLWISAFDTVQDDDVLFYGIADIGERLRGEALKALDLHMIAHQYRADTPVRRILRNRKVQLEVTVGDG